MRTREVTTIDGRAVREVCAVPGCGRMLGAATVTGVCREHNHAAGFCRCDKCRARARPAVAAPKDAPSEAAPAVAGVVRLADGGRMALHRGCSIRAWGEGSDALMARLVLTLRGPGRAGRLRGRGAARHG